MAGLFVAIAICISVVSPFEPRTGHFHGQEKKVLCKLDVCGLSGHSLLSGREMPSICECPCKVVPLEFAVSYSASQPQGKLLLIPARKERPPQA